MQTVRTLRTGRSEQPRGGKMPIGPRRTRGARRPLGARLTRVALWPGGTGRAVIPAVALGAASAVRTTAILLVAGAILIHVLGGQVTRAILVQIPAMQTVRTLRTGIALGTLRARAPLEAPWTRLAWIPLEPLLTLRAGVARVTLGTLDTLRARATRPGRSRRPLRAQRSDPARRAARPWRPDSTRVTYQPHRTGGAGGPGCASWTRLARGPDRTRGARGTGGTLRPPSKAQLNFP